MAAAWAWRRSCSRPFHFLPPHLHTWPAGPATIVKPIFEWGHEVGVRDGKQEGSQRVNVLEAQIEVAHRDADTWRSQALVWKSRHEEAVV
ncbi:MAG: hypothetical protein HC793_05235, partial [Aquincola sp.]|nr:hypothetical protein [Aquincola sp.]